MQKVIDTHVHFWDPGKLHYGWLESVPALNRTFLPDHIPADGKDWQIEKIIFVEADCNPEQAFAEAAWVAELAQQNHRIQGIVASAPLEKGEHAHPALQALKKNDLVKGIRRLIQAEAPGFSTQAQFIHGVNLLPAYGFSFDLCIYHHQLPDVIQLVGQCPDVRFVLDHIAKPDIKGGLRDPWRGHLKTLSDFPNVQCKLSGLVTEADHERWTPANLRPYIDHVLDCFGTARVMFGSDSPVVRLASSYERWIDTALEALSGLSAAEKGAVFYENAQRFYLGK